MKFRKYVLVILLVGLNSVKGSSDVKSSLAFVIDDTGSMWNDIAEVKEGADAIFDTVMTSNSSQIEDFVLVTFNDPGTSLRTVTRDRNTFKRALATISVDGGGDCPEMAMGGIELALQKSREASFLYVFTDASAKDHEKFARVEALSQRKRSQVVFVLTGQCGSRHDADYLVYPKLAKATQGHVFHLGKSDVSEILKYVSKTVENRKHVLATKSFPAGYGNKFNVEVDGDTKELVIAVSGTNPSIEVSDSEGTIMATEDITRLPELAVVSVLGVKPGIYNVDVGSTTETYVSVSGTTSVHFQHGFSVIRPTSITDTSPQPVPGIKSHLAIKLATDGNVVLKSVKLLDMDDHVILEEPLKRVNKADQFYITEPIDTPKEMFRIAIKGYDSDNKSWLTRISLTPIKPQDPTVVEKHEKAPTVNIVEGDAVDAEYDQPLQLKCKVSGYPKPDIIWESDDPSAPLNHTESLVEVPYDYMSVLDIEKVNKNVTYTCKAVNSIFGDAKSISVKTVMKIYFNVLESPKDITIEYKKQGQLHCKVDAMPPASVSWFKGLKTLVTDKNIQISDDKTTLFIRSMEPYVADQYICEARNEFNRKVITVRVSITGVEAPKIDKSIFYVSAMKHSSVDIHCNLTKGRPEPTFTWFYTHAYSNSFTKLDVTGDTLHIDDADSEGKPVYRCVAENVIGKDYHDIDLVAEYPPTLTEEVNPSTIVNEGKTVTLKCPVDGSPTPVITWRFNGTVIPRSRRIMFFRDGSMRLTRVTLSDRGNYEFEARNIHGVIRRSTNVDVVVPVNIEVPKKTVISVMVGNHTVLPCVADGFPKPILSWVFHSKDPKIESKTFRPSDASGSLSLFRIQQKSDGFYTCVATNAGGSKNITYEVTVVAPPYIEYTTKQFTAVMEDRLLRIPCRASGKPKPDITWKLNGFNIPSGTPWYDIEADGSLVIKDIDENSAGSYVCHATNIYGTASQVFDAIVKLYPDPGYIKDTIVLEEGSSGAIPCSVPHQKTDQLRWFKDGRIISTEENLVFSLITRRNSGLYTCRVSSFTNAQSGTTKVEVGVKPQFTYNGDKNIEFMKGGLAVMDCDAIGEPMPEIQWFHDGKKMSLTEFAYVFEMSDIREKGHYTCIVSNKFGTVQQEYVITSFECVLDIRSDFDGNNPVMLTPNSREFAKFENIDGFMHIPRDENIVLACPSGFNGILQDKITVTCENEKLFNYNRVSYSYADLKCREKVVPKVIRTGRRCTNDNSEMMNIGVKIREQFIQVYQVCLDLDLNNTIYTKQNIKQSLANVVPKNNIEWFNNGINIDLDSIYDCNHQNNELSSVLDMDFHKYDGCCFAKRQLVNPKDVAAGWPQTATYTHLNVAPQWSTCNSKNWDDIEQRVRALALSADHELHVWTGTMEELQIPDAFATPKNISFSNEGREYPVPKYFWKVVQDPTSKASIAIIQVNVPDLTLKEVRHYMHCRDVCSEVDWMKNRRWRNVNHGFTYCCKLNDFERAFRYSGVFPRHYNLLKDVPFISERYLHVI